MPASPMSDEEFYARFRQRLESTPAQPVNPAAWRSMEKMLNARTQRRRRWLQLGGLLVGVLLLWLGLRQMSAPGPALTAQPAAPVDRSQLAAASPRSGARALSKPAVLARLAKGGENATATSHNSPEQRASETAAPVSVATEAKELRALPQRKPTAGPLRWAEALPFRQTDGATRREDEQLSPPMDDGVAFAQVAAAKYAHGRARLARLLLENRPPAVSRAGLRLPAMAKKPVATKVIRFDDFTGPRPAVAESSWPVAKTRGTVSRRPARTGSAARSRSGFKSDAKRIHVTARIGGAFASDAAQGRPGRPLHPAVANDANTRAATPNATTVPSPSTTAGQASEAVGALALPDWRGVPRFPLPDSLALVRLPALLLLSDSLPPRKPVQTGYRLRIGVLAAPEFSSVRTGPFTTPGTAVGFQLEYRLSWRLRLSAGYLLVTKHYIANGPDYTQSPGYQLNDLKTVRGDCRVIDIPLNLRYDVWQRPNQQLFVGAGLSSLLMRREDFTYHYDVAGQPQTSTWELLNGSNHVFKILNLSAGYERALGERWTVQAEPFLKLPLQGLGFGAVRLSSAGVFFSLKYGLFPVAPAR